MALAQMAPANRPPNVEFMESSVEDRNASIAAGHLVLKPQHMVCVRQIGSKDSIEFIADQWLQQQEDMARNGRLPAEWAAFYRKKYEAFIAGVEGPVNGFPIREWPSINKAMAQNAIAAGVNSVEDLAAANEETLQRIGMGARGLQQKAKAFLDTRNGGVNAEEVAALRAQLADRDERVKSLEDRLLALEAKNKK
jgi:hypothetical protein